MSKNFLKFALRKLAIMILTVFLISFAVFFIITLPPGDFLTNYIGRMADAGEAVPPELIAELRAHYGTGSLISLLTTSSVESITTKITLP